MFTIRIAEANDSAGIAALTQELGYQASAADIAVRLRNLSQSQQDVVLVAATPGQVVAWLHAFVSVRVTSAPFVEVGGLVVQEESRGQGIATKLLQEVSTWSRRQGISKLRVRCNVNREETHRFYHSRGFSETKEQKVFDLHL
ncbi:GNAT family N-acetyltransferase [Pontibacter qinzhouensis]|uniref:GNAT family N-acetyltransferase n=1 Tax=Pontibacter qinzhouensis TaxID=2603253 RepID=A0A5C8K854_9BACT|nr:GNAT family N-acetyltransferase [Pontibacter qinzhouensis]TXK46084.1 GNAT family N-acetyltransferase [Pontibacter qinzhouensis]